MDMGRFLIKTHLRTGKPIKQLAAAHNSGGSGIRTHGDSRLTAFQEPRIRPLCHPSEAATLALPASGTRWRQDRRTGGIPGRWLRAKEGLPVVFHLGPELFDPLCCLAL